MNPFPDLSMDLDLKNLGQTIAAGGFAIYSVVLLIRLYHPKWEPPLFRFSQASLNIQEIVVALALIFAMGIIVESMSKNISSGRDPWLEERFDIILQSDKELRVRSLFKVYELSKSRAQVIKSSMLQEIFRLETPPETIRLHLERLISTLNAGTIDDKGVITIDGKDNVKAFTDSVNQVYYYSKNSVYQTSTYFDELNEIESRIDFTRSLTLLCVIFFVTYLLFGGLSFIPQVKKYFKFTLKRNLTITGISFLFFLGVIFSGMAYRLESTNYNLRVFGYYVSQKLDPTNRDQSK